MCVLEVLKNSLCKYYLLPIVFAKSNTDSVCQTKNFRLRLCCYENFSFF